MNTPAAPPRKVFPATSVPPPNAESSDPEDEQDGTPKATQNRSKENSQSKRETRRLSQAEWTALPVSSPTEAETVSMSDELRSSPARPGSPLFIPSETQPSFPFSQYQDIETQETQPPHSPDDSDDEAEVFKSVTTSRRPSMASGYRGLSQIASQPKGKRFGLSLLPSSQPVRAKPTTTEDLYGKSLNLDSDSDDSDSDSGSDAGKSHIPKSRRAGKKV
ncbi:hypothetical protein VNI00_004050 [Paramarasmius palmivorus]|uniref:Uncharacterized protein n=1 Tax=Paramarasmius palmivorus TaxID=297713 RepID=A0AAW0DPK5_9AGAR